MELLLVPNKQSVQLLCVHDGDDLHSIAQPWLLYLYEFREA